jgi:putative addiction module component (TIGR02574 family)
MTKSQILTEFNLLPQEDRASVAEEIILASQDQNNEDAWRTEVRSRIAEIESGKIKAIPGDEAMARLRRAAGR